MFLVWGPFSIVHKHLARDLRPNDITHTTTTLYYYTYDCWPVSSLAIHSLHIPHYKLSYASRLILLFLDATCGNGGKRVGVANGHERVKM